MFAGEGDPAAPTAASTCSPRASRPPACRPRSTRSRSTASTPTERPDIYGKVGNSGVSIATLDDMKVLYDGLRPVRPVDLGVDDHQRAGAHHPRHVPQHGHRPAPRALPRRAGPRAHRGRGRRAAGLGPGERAGHGAGRHPQGGPGPEHLHLLDRVLARDDGRHRRVVRRAPGPQLLLRVDLRLPHRRGRREPHQPARLHPGQRLHLRRGVPGPGHGHRRLRPQPLVLLLATAWTPSTPCSAGWPAASGPSPCATATAPTSAPRSSSTTCRPRAGRCTPRRWRSTTSAPRCRRSAPSTTTPTACTPTPTTRRSPRRPPSRCAGRSPSSWSSTGSGAWR